MNLDGDGFVYCTQCGSGIAAADNFCSSCGTKKIVPEKKTVAKMKFCELCAEPSAFSETECSNCGGTSFSHVKPENFDDSKLIAEPAGQDFFKAIRPEEIAQSAKASEFDWRAHSKLIIGSVVVAAIFCGLLIFTSVFKNYASAETVIEMADRNLRANICAEEDSAAAAKLIRDNKDSNLNFKDNEGTDFAIFTEVKRVCKQLLSDDSTLVSDVSDINNQKKIEAARLEEERIAAEKLRAKWEPILKKWDDRAIAAGSGDLADYLSATASAESLIKAGAQYSLTGASREVQSAYCWATQYSLWFQGEPGGWWSCYINFLGGGEGYSVEFSNGNWSGKADSGSRAGRDLNWKIPEGLTQWMASR